MKLPKSTDKLKAKPVNIEDVTIPMLTVKAKTHNVQKGKNGYGYKEIYAGFDIETTNVIDREQNIKNAFMWIWQFSYNDYIIIGRTWEQFRDLLCKIIVANKLNKSKRLLLLIANMGFEFQFFRKHFDEIKVFARKERQPISAILFDCIECRDALTLSGGGLADLAKNYTRTQKKVGDLDYSKLRNKSYVPTFEEFQYIYNDVIILAEFSKYLFTTFIKKQHYLPMTKTSINRHEMKSEMCKEDKEKIKDGFPSYHDYKILMNYVFRGGYVHGSCDNIGVKLTLERMFDFTSSYPAVMLHFKYFPWGQPIEVFNVSRETLKQKINENTRFYFKATFTNIHSTTNHSIESENKCLYLQKPIIDNGRVHRAEILTTWLCDYDYRIYSMFYEWDSMIIESFYEFPETAPLPDYVLDPLKTNYIKKAELKKNGENYALQKSFVNSLYGCMVTRLYETEITYSNGQWGETGDKFNFEKVRKKQFLLPQWGIYVTAVARYNLLYNVWKIDKDRGDSNVVFCDTDSMKIKVYDDVSRETIETWNNDIARQNANLPAEFYDIGMFDCENKAPVTFMTRGAKRYIYEDEKGIHVTIAGLPKKALVDYCEKTGKDIYSVFSTRMMIPFDDSDKLTTCYNDEETSAIVNGEIMTELSSVALFEIPFTMSVTKEYIAFYERMQQARGGII